METKICTCCGKEYPATAEYFHRNKAVSSGLVSVCKNCACLAKRKYRLEHLEEIRNKDKERRYGKEREQILVRSRKYYQEHKEEFIERSKQQSKKTAEQNRIVREKYYAENKEEIELQKQRRKQESKEKQCLAMREYYQKNKEAFSEYRKKYQEKNREYLAEQKRIWRANNVEESRARVKRYQEQNPEVKRKSVKKYRATITGHMRTVIGNGIRDSLKGRRKGICWQNIVGYKVEDLTQHLEAQFTEGMSWANYGEWHVDHIRPVASFNFNVADYLAVVKECWALSNLQPLWAIENLMKGARYEEEVI
jgi:actin-related protein